MIAILVLLTFLECFGCNCFNADWCRAKEDLVRMLNDATELGKALEDNVHKYKEL